MIYSQPDGRGKTDAMGHVVWNWTNADPQAASAWLIEQPAGEARDRGIGALSKATFDSDPAAAVIWAAEISNEQTREASLDRGVRGWLERDPEAAKQWLNTTDVISAEGGFQGEIDQDFLARALSIDTRIQELCTIK